MIEYGAEVLSGQISEIAEGPLWDARRGWMWWLDVLVGDIHAHELQTGREYCWRANRIVSSLATRGDGSFLASLQDGFGSFDPATGVVERLVPLEEDITANRLNDGKVDPAGRFWAGTMEFDGASGAGSLYCLRPDLTYERRVTDISISNGLGWSPDHRLMYYIDTRTYRVDVFDYDVETGAIANRRTFIEVPAELGTPDGMCVDAEGCVWMAVFGDWGVRRYAPDGTLIGRVTLPVSNATSCAFGGADLTELFVTTAYLELSQDQRRDQPLAGAVFRTKLDVPGLPVPDFAG